METNNFKIQSVMETNNFANKLFNNYTIYNDNIKELIKKRSDDIFEINTLGLSIEDREIYLLKIGTGKTKIILWSQMHGNESTGTMALADMFNFFEDENSFLSEKKDILTNCTLYIIPMLNPDGAEVFKRRNALDIDINRDAANFVTPEAKMLIELIKEIEPEFAYNLHDQEIFYSAGNTNFPATISLLTPAYNFERDIDKSRIKSMQLIVSTHKMLQQYIPKQVAKYYDDYMLNAFGDNVQKLGVATLLIESGGYKDDPEKQYVRKLNFVLILSGIHTIANKLYVEEDYRAYDKIPFNKKNKLFNIIFRNATIINNGKEYTADIGIRQKSELHKDSMLIDDIGDLSQYAAYEEIDYSGKEITTRVKIGEKSKFFIDNDLD